MKNKLKIITILAAGIFLLPTCQKDRDLRMPELRKGIIPVVEKDGTKDMVIFDNNLSGFAGKVTVALLYPDEPKKVDLMVSMNDDPDNTGTAIADIKTWPASYDVTITKLVDLLPKLDNASQLKAGDFFRFYCDITLMDGTLIHGNDTLYAAYSSGIYNIPGASPDVVFPVACGYEPALASGSYNAFSPPDQWAISGPISITVDPVDNTKLFVTGLAALDGVTEDKGPLVMHIDPVTFAVVADKTVLASDAWGETNIAYEGSGSFNSCTGLYEMNFNISTDQYDYGVFSFTFTRN